MGKFLTKLRVDYTYFLFFYSEPPLAFLMEFAVCLAFNFFSSFSSGEICDIKYISNTNRSKTMSENIGMEKEATKAKKANGKIKIERKMFL